MSKTTEWRKNNPEKAAAAKAAYRKKQRQADAKYYQKNREKIITRQLAYDAERKDKIMAYASEWRKKNSEKMKSYLSQWRANNRPLCQQYHHVRRARIFGNGGRPSVAIVQKLMALQKGKCVCCRKDLKNNNPHLDHIMPLALGGGSNDDNLQLLCARCNLQKHSKHPIDFMQSRGFLL